MEKNSNKIINAWCSYDIGNSAYNLIISTVLYPIYYSEVTKAYFNSENINFLRIELKNTVLYEYAIALGYLVVILVTLLFSGIVDVGGYRKGFMKIFTYIGALSCSGLYWFTGGNIVFGIVLPALAVVGYAGSLVYYNSFLPIIATKDKHDVISARGFSFGYAGSMLLLLGSLVMIEGFEAFGFNDKLDAVRTSFLVVGVWWAGIAQISFFHLKDYPSHQEKNKGILLQGFREIGEVYKSIKGDRNTGLFLLSFFMFSMGVQTIMLIAPLFGKTELNITGTKLIITVIIIQIVAIVGALVFGKISARYGNKRSLLIMIVIWILSCWYAYFITSEYQFYVLAAFVGFVMGGIQSQARSTFSKMIPKDSNKTASYFSFYSNTEKLAVVLGMASFAFLEELTGNMRLSAILLSVYFILSFIILVRTSLKSTDN